ncbi:type VI secretion system-associated FHA domain protein TagH [Paraburkholderia tropica]|uniref:FHA domain protein n=1 Tax=Paraburkholderia tropica TaxID=92647 RepID=A0ABX5ML09_9BURK|nr:type VI secretion system-associated FHA domain protein TagH [Paraburkholderia tropica]MDE1139876.1 type VI secretion system-associated FHA domain protein TagH [Paraburkholderia tropica]PXX09009.1 FHA domain protein [Paraburkholderia tropica]PZW74220.1 FHA domain protein [Paraburkholderia tropica]
MNPAVTARHIALVVTNPHLLQHGCTPRHSFDRTGGTIGCRGANWILADRSDLIQPIHCEILMKDGGFCVVDRSGQTFINGNDTPLGHLVAAQLSDGDLMQIGPYRVSVHLADAGAAVQQSVDDLVGSAVRQSTITDLPTAGDDSRGPRGYAAQETQDTSRSSLPDLDPLLALDAAERPAQPVALSESFDPVHYGMAPARPQVDHAATRFEAVSGTPRSQSGEFCMASQPIESPLVQEWINAQSSSHSTPHQTVAPLLRGLGLSSSASLGALDEHEAYRLLHEAGLALNATIRRLTELYGSKQDPSRGPALLDRTLQPIEDNPLRLGLGYTDTVEALFASDRSIVHLSPMAAIDESLTQVRRHNEALIEAINTSLQALLRAFSPEVLLQRFRRYRPDGAQQSDAQEWAWQMYTHYYNELASPRQKGFEKLFWEVFEQSYDQALRNEAP